MMVAMVVWNRFSCYRMLDRSEGCLHAAYFPDFQRFPHLQQQVGQRGESRPGGFQIAGLNHLFELINTLAKPLTRLGRSLIARCAEKRGHTRHQ
jgi:hypothetical protein